MMPLEQKKYAGFAWRLTDAAFGLEKSLWPKTRLRNFDDGVPPEPLMPDFRPSVGGGETGWREMSRRLR
jgi:hypothetical protein